MKYFYRTQNQTLRYRNIRNNFFLVHCMSSTVVKKINKIEVEIGKHRCALLIIQYTKQIRIGYSPFVWVANCVSDNPFQMMFPENRFLRGICCLFQCYIVFCFLMRFQLTSCTVLRVQNKLSLRSFSPAK